MYKPYRLKPAPKPGILPVRALRKMYRLWYRDPRIQHIIRTYISKLPYYPDGPDQTFSIHSLICDAHSDMAIATFKTLNALAGRNFRISFHDDGSLQKETIAKLHAHLNCRIIQRQEADLYANEQLKAYPQILEYRRCQIMALKLVDVHLFAYGEKQIYCDSDILFFMLPQFLLDRAADANDTTPYFNKDIITASAFPAELILSTTGFQLKPQINAGLWVAHRSMTDPVLLESFLREPAFADNKFSYLADQTYINILAQRQHLQYLPEGYDVDLYKLPERCICKHYVGQIRHGYALEGLNYQMNNSTFLHFN